MNIPEKVKIGYKDYKITKVDNTLISADKVCYGNIEYDKANINISTIYDEDQQKCTLIHECLHGIDEMVETDLTEEQVRLIAKGLYDFIKSNSQLFIDINNDTEIFKKIRKDEISFCGANKLEILRYKNADSLRLNKHNVPWVTDYSINKKGTNITEVTLTFDCANIEIIDCKEKEKLTFKEALEAMKEGKKVKLPEWEGYWIWNKEKESIFIHCKDGKVLDIRETQDVYLTISNVVRKDWEVFE